MKRWIWALCIVLGLAIASGVALGDELDAPILLSPLNAAEVTNPVVLSWTPVNGATEYQFCIRADERPCSCCGYLHANTVKTTYTADLSFVRSFPTDFIFYWQVRAIDANGQPGKWSDFGSFRWEPKGAVLPEKPEISFSLMPPEYLSKETVRINGTIILRQGHIDHILWEWGDGTSERRWFPAVHTYLTPGSYTVRVTALADDGHYWTRETCVVVESYGSVKDPLWPHGGILVTIEDWGWANTVIDPFSGRVYCIKNRILSVTPNGHLALFREGPGWKGALFLADPSNPSNRKEVTLPKDIDAIQPKLSPHGRYIALIAPVGEPDEYGVRAWELFIKDLETGACRQVTHESAKKRLGTPLPQVLEFDWSPDGKRLVYATNTGLYLIDVDGSNRMPLPNVVQYDGPGLDWAPDGQITYFSQAGISSYNVATGRSEVLVNFDGLKVSLGNRFGLAWSPDSKVLAFSIPIYHANSQEGTIADAEVFTFDREHGIRRITNDSVRQDIIMWLPKILPSD